MGDENKQALPECKDFVSVSLPPGFNRQHHIILILASLHLLLSHFRIDSKILLITF